MSNNKSDVVLLCNPAAGGRWKELAGILDSEEARYVRRVVTDSIDDVGPALVSLSRRTKLICIYGGDGTIQRVLDAFYLEAEAIEDPPQLAFIGGGTMNVGARWCGLTRSPRRNFRDVVRAYRRGTHLAVLFDEVASPKFVVSNKKVLQAHVDGAILGQSATQLYTYEVFLHKTPLMLTTIFWEYADFNAADKNWIEANCVAVCIDTPVWEAAPAASEVPELPFADALVRSPAQKRTR